MKTALITLLLVSNPVMAGFNCIDSAGVTWCDSDSGQSVDIYKNPDGSIDVYDNNRGDTILNCYTDSFNNTYCQ